MMLPTMVSAQQNLRTGYFLDGYIYKYKMNPALAPERGFFSMPVLGNLSVGTETNIGLSTFLYPTQEGGLTTFLSPRVSHEQFQNNIAKNNNMNLNLNMNILAFGFRTGKAYHTVDLSTRVDAGVNIPGSLFTLIKTGSALGDYTWDISNIGLKSVARAELAYGYSRSFGESLRVGARAKLLIGLMNMNIALDKMYIEMSPERWAIQTHGNMMVSAPFSFGVNEDNTVDWFGIDTENMMSNLMNPSMGFALDLGATYDFLDYFTASLSVTDLGFISWKNTLIASTPESMWSFEGFGNVDIEMEGMQDQFTDLTTDLTNAFAFISQENGVKKSKALAATINAAVEARMPFYERLSFGLLYTQRIDGVYSMSEGRLAMSLAPTNWFSLTTNYAISNYGHSWGGAFNLHLKGFGIFAGLDSFAPIMNVTPQFIPVNELNTNVALGINFTFGKYNGRYPKKTKEEKKNKK